MNYPVELSFKILALASQIYIRDASGGLIGYVKQKMFKLKENIEIYSDENKSELIYTIKADRILDFSANYSFTDVNGKSIGSIRRKGMRSILKAHYLIFDSNQQQVFEVHEENAWIKVIDALVGEVPVVGMFTGYLFNPAYLVTRMNGNTVVRVQKQPAFFEGKFQIELKEQMSESDEELILLSNLMMVLLERRRG